MCGVVISVSGVGGVNPGVVVAVHSRWVLSFGELVVDWVSFSSSLLGVLVLKWFASFKMNAAKLMTLGRIPGNWLREVFELFDAPLKAPDNLWNFNSYFNFHCWWETVIPLSTNTYNTNLIAMDLKSEEEKEELIWGWPWHRFSSYPLKLWWKQLSSSFVIIRSSFLKLRLRATGEHC